MTTKITTEVETRHKTTGGKKSRLATKQNREEHDKLANSQERVSNMSNQVKRNMDGVTARTGAQARDFSRLRQGLGGVVSAYATVAANIFAVSAAFNALNRAAQFESMIVGSERLAQVSGKNYLQIARDLQRATDSTISFEESLGNVNKILASGANTQQIEQLGELAQKASQVFAGDTRAFLDRFVDSIIRGEVQLLKTIGITKTLDNINKDFAETLGKTTQELSAQERQMAVLNAILDEGGRLFADVETDSSPFEQLRATITDLKQDVLGFASGVTGPLVSAIGQSQGAVTALGLMAVKYIGGMALPSLNTLAAGFVSSARKAQDSNSATIASIRAMAKESRKSYKQLQADAIQTAETIIREQAKQQKFTNKAITNVIKDPQAASPGQIGMFRAQLAKEMEFRTKRGKSLVSDLSRFSVTQLKQVDTALVAMTKKGEAVFRAKERAATSAYSRMSMHAQVFAQRAKSAMLEVKASAGSAFQTTNLQGIGAGFKVLIAQANTANPALEKLAARGNLSAAALMRLDRSARVAGAGIGFLAGAVSKAVALAFKLYIAFQTVNFVLDSFGLKLFKANEEQEKAIKISENYADRVEQMSTKLADFKEMLEFTDRTSFEGLVREINFVNNALEESQGIISGIRKETRAGLDLGGTVSAGSDEFFDQLDEFRQGTKAFEDEIKAFDTKISSLRVGSIGFLSGVLGLDSKLEETRAARKELELELSQLEASTGIAREVLENQLEALKNSASKDIASSFSALAASIRVAEASNFADAISHNFTSAIDQSIVEIKGAGIELSTALENTLVTAIRTGDASRIKDAFDLITESANLSTEEQVRLRFAIENALNAASSQAFQASTRISNAYGQIEEASRSLGEQQTNLSNKFMQEGELRPMLNSISSLNTALQQLSADNAISSLSNLDESMQALLKNVFGLDINTVSVGDATEIIQDKYDSLNKAMVALRRESSELARLEANKEIISNRQAKTAVDIVRQAKEQAEAEKNILATRSTLANKQSAMFDMFSKIVGKDTEHGRLLALQAEESKAQAVSLGIQSDNLSSINAAEEARFTHKREQLSIDRLLLNAQNSLNQVNSNIANTLEDKLANQRESIELSRLERELQNQELEAEIHKLENTEDADELTKKRLETLRQVLDIQQQVNSTTKIENELALRKLEFEEGIQARLSGRLENLSMIESAQSEIFGMNVREEQVALNVANIQRRQLDTQLQLNKAKQNELNFQQKITGLSAGEEEKLTGLKLEETILGMRRQVLSEEREILAARARQASTMLPGGENFLDTDIREMGQLFGQELGYQAREQMRQIIPPMQQAASHVLEGFDNVTNHLIDAIYQGDLSLRAVVDNLRKTIADILLDMSKEGMSAAVRGLAGGLFEKSASSDKDEGPGAIVSSLNAMREAGEYAHSEELTSLNTLLELQGEGNLMTEALKFSSDAKQVTMISLLTGIYANTSMMAATAGSEMASDLAGAFTGFMTGGAAANGRAVTTGPTLAGEAGPEAIVPLPGNKKIPVEIKQDSDADSVTNNKNVSNEESNSSTINIVQNFDFSNADKRTENQLKEQSKRIEESTIQEVFRRINAGGSYAKMTGRR